MRTATKFVQVTATSATKTLSSADNVVHQMIVLRGTSPIHTLDILSCAFLQQTQTIIPGCGVPDTDSDLVGMPFVVVVSSRAEDLV